MNQKEEEEETKGKEEKEYGEKEDLTRQLIFSLVEKQLCQGTWRADCQVLMSLTLKEKKQYTIKYGQTIKQKEEDVQLEEEGEWSIQTDSFFFSLVNILTDFKTCKKTNNEQKYETLNNCLKKKRKENNKEEEEQEEKKQDEKHPRGTIRTKGTLIFKPRSRCRFSVLTRSPILMEPGTSREIPFVFFINNTFWRTVDKKPRKFLYRLCFLQPLVHIEDIPSLAYKFRKIMKEQQETKEMDVVCNSFFLF